MSKMEINDVDFIDFKMLKANASETIQYFEDSYTGARMVNDVRAMQAFANAIAALQSIRAMPDDELDKYKTPLA